MKGITMKKIVGQLFGTWIFVLTLMQATAHADMESTELLAGFGLTPDEIARLENGEILAYSDAEFEFSKRELSADAMVHVDTDHAAVLRAMQEDATLIPVKLLIEHTRISSEADFDDVKFTEEEYGEVEELFDAKVGKDFNLSNDEYALLQQILKPHRSGTNAQKMAAASDAMRAVLIGRYNAYRVNGLAGIEGYQRSKRKKVDVGAELQLTNDAFRPFEDDFPEFVRLMYGYPEAADCCKHEFRWLKVKIRKRIAFALAHTMIQATDTFALITERHYYVSNTLNSVQLTIVWLPYEDGGSIGLAMSASADVLNSLMGRILRPVGRNLAKDTVTDAMLDIKAALEEGASQ